MKFDRANADHFQELASCRFDRVQILSEIKFEKVAGVLAAPSWTTSGVSSEEDVPSGRLKLAGVDIFYREGCFESWFSFRFWRNEVVNACICHVAEKTSNSQKAHGTKCKAHLLEFADA